MDKLEWLVLQEATIGTAAPGKADGSIRHRVGIT
jgi:hypothetical protein